MSTARNVAERMATMELVTGGLRAAALAVAAVGVLTTAVGLVHDQQPSPPGTRQVAGPTTSSSTTTSSTSAHLVKVRLHTEQAPMCLALTRPPAAC